MPSESTFCTIDPFCWWINSKWLTFRINILFNFHKCTLWNKPRRQIYRCFYKQQKCSKLQRKGGGNCWQSVKKSFFSESIWNLHPCYSIQSRRCIWMQEMPCGTTEGGKRGRFWRRQRSSHQWWNRYGKHAVPLKRPARKRPFQCSQSNHRCALLRVTSELFRVNIFNDSVSTFLTILCQHFWRFCV